MSSPGLAQSSSRGVSRSGRWLLAAVAVAVVAVVVVACGRGSGGPSDSSLPLRPVAEVALPGDGSRFDYASLDAGRGLLFVAHLGASQIVEVDVRAHRVVRVIPRIARVHGVLVVPGLRRVFATATGANSMVGLDEDTGAAVFQARTGDYPDGLTYDPRRGAVWTTNEPAGSETAIDAASGAVRGTVRLGEEVGNVVYDPVGDHVLVAVQSDNELAVLDPARMAVLSRIGLPGCAHDHGLALDVADRLVFVACDGNAVLLTVDLDTGRVVGTDRVGTDPDVLTYDPSASRLYVAAESGTVTVLGVQERRVRVVGSGYLADGAHVVAVDPATHHSFYPVPAGHSGGPAVLEEELTRG